MTTIVPSQDDLMRPIDPYPFLPNGNAEQQSEQLETILHIQAHGLAGRLRNMPVKRVVLGLSGGLDSTLALLVAVRASELLKIQTSQFIYTLTMPAAASSHRTQSNAVQLAQILDIPNDEIPIAHLVAQQQEALCHDGSEDVTYENIQARIRQALVFNKANQIGGIALGTGDLTESMIGWCTYGGDQTSGYHINSSVPKTLVRSLVLHASEMLPHEARTIINDIVDTPISPELTGTGKELSQQTEDTVGPMELLDFFLYHTLRWQDSPRKIGFLALKAFGHTYSESTIAFWLERFRERFYQSQWKRQAMPDGPRIGLSANPRGDLRLLPDMNSQVAMMY